MSYEPGKSMATEAAGGMKTGPADSAITNSKSGREADKALDGHVNQVKRLPAAAKDTRVFGDSPLPPKG